MESRCVACSVDKRQVDLIMTDLIDSYWFSSIVLFPFCISDPDENSVSLVLMAPIFSLFTLRLKLCQQLVMQTMCVCWITSTSVSSISSFISSLIRTGSRSLGLSLLAAVCHDSVRFTSYPQLNSLDLICQELQTFDALTGPGLEYKLLFIYSLICGAEC